MDKIDNLKERVVLDEGRSVGQLLNEIVLVSIALFFPLVILFAFVAG